MFIKINDLNISYEEKGSGRPLIMVHGNGEDLSIFNEASEVLKDHFKVYLIDSRDHGKSDKTKDIRYELMADDVKEFIKQKDLDDVVFYGFSDGGIIGLLLCQDCDRVSRLIISGANITPNGVKANFRFLIKVLYFFTRDKKMELMLKEPHISKEDLSKIKVKTTVIAGEKDLIYEEETKTIADNIENAKLLILPKEGHGSYIVHKTKIADIIIDEVNSDN